MKMYKKQSGITLIALVVTIIVMLILASVSIANIANTNGNSTTKSIKNKVIDQNEKIIEQQKQTNSAITGVQNDWGL